MHTTQTSHFAKMHNIGRTCRDGSRCHDFQERSAVWCLARPYTPTTQLRRKNKTGTDQPARQRLCRTLLIQGARSKLQSAFRADPLKTNHLQQWIIKLYGRKGYHKTLIAIANKHARILWAMLAEGDHYDESAWQRHPMNQASPIGNQ